MVMMSGVASWVSNAHRWLPTRPKPICTSSAITTAPAARAAAWAACRYPSGSTICPAELGSDSAMKAARPLPSFASADAISATGWA